MTLKNFVFGQQYKKDGHFSPPRILFFLYNYSFAWGWGPGCIIAVKMTSLLIAYLIYLYLLYGKMFRIT